MLVSVIIPCYNVEEYIEECLESVASQTYKQIEIICIDNNSTDNTWNILCQLKEKHKLVIIKEFIVGACVARNKGLSVAKGDWIQFLDADDLLLPSKIEHQLRLVQDKSVGFVAGAWKNRALNGTEINIIQFHQNIFKAVFKSQSGNTCSNLWSKQSLNLVNDWDESLKSSQEAYLMMSMALAGSNFVTDNEVLTIIREREFGQISQQNPAENLERFIEVRLKYLNNLEIRFPIVFHEIKNELFSYLLPFLIKLHHFESDIAINLYNNNIKSKLSVDLRFKKAFIVKVIGLKLFIKLQKKYLAFKKKSNSSDLENLKSWRLLLAVIITFLR